MGCFSEPPEIEYVFPNGYQGRVIIFTDPKNGVQIRESARRFRVNIPPSGVLGVSDDSPFTRWHTTIARYEDGTPLPYEPNGPAAPGTPMMFSGSSAVEKGIEYSHFYVGTKQNHDRQVGVAEAEKAFAEELEKLGAGFSDK